MPSDLSPATIGHYIAFDTYNFADDPDFVARLDQVVRPFSDSSVSAQERELEVLQVMVEHFSSKVIPIELTGYVEWKRSELSETLTSRGASDQSSEMACPFAPQRSSQAEVAGQIPADFWTPSSPSTHSLTHYHPPSLAPRGAFSKQRGLHVLVASAGSTPRLFHHLASSIRRSVKEYAHAIVLLLPSGTSLPEGQDSIEWEAAYQSLRNAIRECGPKGHDESIPILLISQGSIPARLTPLLILVDWHVTTTHSTLSPSQCPNEALAPVVQGISQSFGPASSMESVLSAALWVLLSPLVTLRPPEMVSLGLSCGFILENDIFALLDRLILLTSFPVASPQLIRSLITSYITSEASLVSPGLSKYKAISEMINETFGEGLEYIPRGASGEAWVKGVRDRLHNNESSPWAKETLEGLDVQEKKLGPNGLAQFASKAIHAYQSLEREKFPLPETDLKEESIDVDTKYVEIKRTLQAMRTCPVMHG
ncbi:hypothetical protein BJ684DRAFT_15626 [Piptocephalis cylindrospora]|uniref:PEX14-like helix-turn-helix domain-containing protein n=1 Tax=Piptocephalis cylindrospora TaxID=1907219 RepID=A0A4P9Y4V5_9FUNG|nr:hypothetical protein BJ684DRAFT_15626 [Piptocephalis cylindrospora]|eukprot:RKP14018.1 hypothetical protein BJ684DRAFT_15626 [Piptocephalis cylindrospora]